MRALLLIVAILAGCGGAPRPRPAPAEPWQRVELPGVSTALYAYPDPIERYAPDDRGAYVVRIAIDAPGRDALLASLGATDDILGEDGVVVRLAAGERDALAARPGVAAIAILQPSARRSGVTDVAAGEVRIDLFADASAGEVDAIAAWIEGRGGRVRWRGRNALRAEVPRAALVDASRLSPVRWIE